MEKTDTLLHNPFNLITGEPQLGGEPPVTFPSFPKVVETFTSQREPLREPLMEYGTILAAPGVSVTNFDGQQRVIQPGVNGNTKHSFDTQALNDAAQRTAENIRWDIEVNFHLLEFGLVRKAATDATEPRDQSFLVINRCGRNCEAGHGVSDQLASYHSGVYVIHEAIDERIRRKFNSIDEFNSKLLKHIHQHNHEFYQVQNQQLVQSGSWTRIIPPEAVVNGMLDILGIDIRALVRSTAPQDLALKNAVQELFATLSSTEVDGQRSADGTIILDYALTPVHIKDTDGNSTGWTLLTSRGDLYFNSITNWTPQDRFVQQEAHSFNQLLTQGQRVEPVTMEHNASMTSQRRKEFDLQTTVVEHQPGSKRTLVFQDGFIQVQLEIQQANGVHKEVIEFQQALPSEQDDVVNGDVPLMITTIFASSPPDIGSSVIRTTGRVDQVVRDGNSYIPTEISQTTPPPPSTVLLQVTAGLQPRQRKQPSQQQFSQARPTRGEQQPVYQFLVTNPSDSPAPSSPSLSTRLRVPCSTIALRGTAVHNVTHTESTRTSSLAKHQTSTTSQAVTNQHETSSQTQTATAQTAIPSTRMVKQHVATQQRSEPREIKRTQSDQAHHTAPNTHSSVETSAESRRRSSQSVQTSEGTDRRKVAPRQVTTRQQVRQRLQLQPPSIQNVPFRKPTSSASQRGNTQETTLIASEERVLTPRYRIHSRRTSTRGTHPRYTHQQPNPASTGTIRSLSSFGYYFLGKQRTANVHASLQAHAEAYSPEELTLMEEGLTPLQIQQALLERRSGHAA